MRKQIYKIKDKSLAKRARRRLSIRKKVIGTAEKPRICAMKSNRHLQVQVIDDTSSKTLVAVQTFGKHAVQGATDNKEGAKAVGVQVASELKKKNISRAVFDRAGYKYTGVIAALVQSIRENGIQV